MRRAPVAGGGEGLVPGDLRSGHPGAIHSFKRERIAAFVGDADGLEHADFPGFAARGGNHVARLFEFELEGRSHVVVPGRRWSMIEGIAIKCRDRRF